MRNIHRCEHEGIPVMLGTLVITDAKTIEEIEEGKHTDLSCGYDCDIDDSENPQQKNIRGNHVALCEQGRAGIARIMDSVKDEESTYTEVTKNLEKEAKKDMSWLDAVVKDSNDFVNSHEHRRLIYEFMENNGNSFIISKEKNRLLKYIEKETGIKNADWHDVMYIIKNHTRAKLFDEEEVKDVEQLRDSVKDFVNDGKRLPTKVKNEIQKFLNHKSTFIKNRDYDVSEFVREFERITKLWIEFPLKITRESIKGWNKTGDGMMRKDYVFSIDGYDEKIIISLYAKPDTYETTEINTYFLDSVANKDYVPLSEYEIRWIDKISKTRGESRESFVHNDIIKARTVKEALQSVANRVALGGIGTANTEISSVNERRDGKTISYVQLWGKLSDIIKKV